MTESDSPVRLGDRLARNTLLNLTGLGTPFVVAVFAIPPLIAKLGIDRFGVLTLIWMVVSYLGLFDFGLARALTQQFSERLGKGEVDTLPGLAWNALALAMLLGILGGLAIIAVTPWAVEGIIKIPAQYRAESKQAFYITAASLPFVVSTAGLRGILESYQQFGIINAIRLPLGVFTFLGPLAVTYVNADLSDISAVLVLARVIAWLLHGYYCLKLLPTLGRTVRRVEQRFIRPLLASGGWMTVSNLAGPFIAYFDRVVIGTVVSVAAVAYYATPNEVITKLWILSGALTGALFPVFAAQAGVRNVVLTDLLVRSSKYLFLMLFPLSLTIALFAPEILGIWLGPEFRRESSQVLQWLAIGTTANCLAQIPFTLLQGVGQSRVTAKIHLVELALYSPAMIAGVSLSGINGAALVWTVRALLDMLAMYTWASRALGLGVSLQPKLVGFLLLVSGAFALPFVEATTEVKWIFLLLSTSGILWVFWRVILNSGDRQALLDVPVRLASFGSWEQR